MMCRMSVVSLALMVMVAVGCQTTQGTQRSDRMVMVDGQSLPAEQVAETLYQQAIDKRKADDLSGAEQDLKRLIDDYGDTSWVDFAMVALAQIHLDQDQPEQAQKLLEQLLLERPASDAADQARYLLALSQLEQGDAASAAPTLKSIVENIPDPAEKREAALKLSRELAAQGQGGEAARYLSQAHRLTDNPDEKAAREAELVALIDQRVNFTDLRRLQETEAQPGTILDEVLAYKLARVHLHLGDAASADERLKYYLSKYPTGRFADDAKALQKRLENRVALDAKSIGVLLPLTGKFAGYGERVLSALLLGAGAKPPEKLGPGTYEAAGVRFVVRDTQGDPQHAGVMVKELVETDHVIAIVGDILLDTALPIAQRADEYGVPLLSLSRQQGVAELSGWTFRLGFTPRKQAQALATLAMERLGHKRFAIVYPRHSYGVEVMNGFWDEVEKRNGEVTAIESYAHDQTTFTEEAKSIVGRLHLEARGQYTACRSEARALEDKYKVKKALEACRDEVKPIVDFDALLIPDDYRTVSFVVPALVAEDILLTDDAYTVQAYRKTTNSKARPVQLLGGSLWNNPELGKRLGRQIDGALFVDGFSSESGKTDVKKFVTVFQKIHRSPPGLLEAHGRDAGALMVAVMGKQPKSRAAMRDALQGVKDFPGVTGLVRFDDVGDSATEPLFFQIKRGRFELVENLNTLGDGQG